MDLSMKEEAIKISSGHFQMPYDIVRDGTYMSVYVKHCDSACVV